MQENIIKYAVLDNKLKNPDYNNQIDIIKKEMQSLVQEDEDLQLYESEMEAYKASDKSFSPRGSEILNMINEARLDDKFNVSQISLEKYLSLIEETKEDKINNYLLRQYFKKRFGKAVEIILLEKECGCSVEDTEFPTERLLIKAAECQALFEEEYKKGSISISTRYILAKKEYTKAYAEKKGIPEGDVSIELNRYLAPSSESTEINNINTQTSISHSVSYATGIVLVDDTLLEIQLNYKKYPFSKLLSFKVNDDVTTIQSPASYETKKSTSSMLGRALVGGLLTGGWGALVGAATAKSKTVQTQPSTSCSKHNYTIIINIDDTSSPIVTLDLADNYQKVEEISCILNRILENNKKSSIPTSAVANNSIADELKKLADLKKEGILTDEEFNQQKAKLLNS